MAKERYYSSKKGGRESGNVPARGEYEKAQHEGDKFNDEHRRDKDNGGIVRRPMSSAELYAGMESRRRSELEDELMIREDHRAIANLPQEVMIKPYPMTGPYLPEELEDTQVGVNKQMDFDDSQRRAHFYPKKI